MKKKVLANEIRAMMTGEEFLETAKKIGLNFYRNKDILLHQ